MRQPEKQAEREFGRRGGELTATDATAKADIVWAGVSQIATRPVMAAPTAWPAISPVE
ncbi:hypothetical protein [Lapillicoccus sp.]|uniref:hypothetical protein n=1 Tax=Lapillicoccus sp. TaxID=1909287 RepID=UPI003264B47B